MEIGCVMEFGWNYHFFEKKIYEREEKVGEREIIFKGRERNCVYVC